MSSDTLAARRCLSPPVAPAATTSCCHLLQQLTLAAALGDLLQSTTGILPGVSADSPNTKEDRHLITLRDYDFVGEDPRLRAALAERMALLQGPVPGPSPPRASRRAPAPPDARHRPGYQPRPDFLHSDLKFPQMVNVSLDYGELYNVSELLSQSNVSWHRAGPAAGLRGPPLPGAGPPTAPTRGLEPEAGPSADQAPGPSADQPASPDGRRQTYKKDPTNLAYNHKVLDLMKQAIYGTQRKILELDSFIKKHEPDPRYRMAYIFNRLDEWLHDLRTVYWAMVRKRTYLMRNKRLIWYYENALRINIDITYSIEHLVFLHSEFMKNMEALMPTEQRVELQKKRKSATKRPSPFA